MQLLLVQQDHVFWALNFIVHQTPVVADLRILTAVIVHVGRRVDIRVNWELLFHLLQSVLLQPVLRKCILNLFFADLVEVLEVAMVFNFKLSSNQLLDLFYQHFLFVVKSQEALINLIYIFLQFWDLIAQAWVSRIYIRHAWHFARQSHRIEHGIRLIWLLSFRNLLQVIFIVLTKRKLRIIGLIIWLKYHFVIRIFCVFLFFWFKIGLLNNLDLFLLKLKAIIL